MTSEHDNNATDPEETPESVADAQLEDLVAQINQLEAPLEADVPAADGEVEEPDDALSAAQKLAAERLDDLQRLNAEYVNFRKRVDRDRAVARADAIGSVAEALISVLDDVDLARQHGDLQEGTPFAAIATKLEETLARFDIVRYGEAGEPFDPAQHEALMHQTSDDVDGPTVAQVLQPGYRVGERIIRAARVAVVDKA